MKSIAHAVAPAAGVRDTLPDAAHAALLIQPSAALPRSSGLAAQTLAV